MDRHQGDIKVTSRFDQGDFNETKSKLTFEESGVPCCFVQDELILASEVL